MNAHTKELSSEAKWLITKFLTGFLLGGWTIVIATALYFTNGVKQNAERSAKAAASEVAKAELQASKTALDIQVSGFFSQINAVQQSAIKTATDASVAKSQAEAAANAAKAAESEAKEALRALQQLGKSSNATAETNSSGAHQSQ